MKLIDALKAINYEWPEGVEIIVCDKDTTCWPSMIGSWSPKICSNDGWKSDFIWDADFNICVEMDEDVEIEDWETILTKEQWEASQYV